MDVNFELVKRIISSDELCDKVNSGDNREIYIKQIQNYVLSLLDNFNSNIDYINRYIRKFVLQKNSEDIFFDKVMLKCGGLNIKDSEYLSILDSMGYNSIKESLLKKYNDYIVNKTKVSSDTLIKMLNFYCYTCSNFVFDSDYINYFTYYLYSMEVNLSFELISYFYKQFALCFSNSKGIYTSFVVLDDFEKVDPYYDNVKNKIIIYKNNIKGVVDPFVLADIFFQITYLYILKGINDSENKMYTFEQLELVKEICLISILGPDYYDVNYSDIGYSSYLKKQSLEVASKYFAALGLNVSIKKDINFISVDRKLDSKTDNVISIDVLFDQIIKRENPNLISSLVRSYPVLGSEYKGGKKKSLLDLILDIYTNKRLLINLNRDLEWYKRKKEDDIVVKPKIEHLNNKISICNSYIGVMNSIIMNGDLTTYDLLRSISDLITYSHSNKMVKNDICLVMSEVIPKKIRRLCLDRDDEYKGELKKKIIKCYLDSLELVKNQISVDYFMKLYSTLQLCISAFDVD